MVVIAGLIGGSGLGDVVTSGLNSYPALAILAGIVIVVMAMAFDRITEAVADRTIRQASSHAELRSGGSVVPRRSTGRIVGTVAAAKESA